MADSNSIDEFFLKASAMEGRNRFAFLRTLPAETRAKVSALLAADESVAKKEFLEDGFHEAGTNDKAEKPIGSPVSRPASQRQPSSHPAEEKRPSRSRRPKTENSRSAQPRRGSRPERQRPPRKSEQAKPDRPAHPAGPLLAGTVAVLVCSTLMWLIVSALKQPALENAEATGMERLTTRVASPIEEVVIPAQETRPKPASVVSAPALSDPTPFYTPAVSAPPLTTQQLNRLPKALSPSAFVTNPMPLPGIRSWTMETVDYRSYIGDIALSSDGALIAYGTQDGNIRILNFQTGQLEKMIVVTDRQMTSLNWGADNTELFVTAAKWGPYRHMLTKIDVATGVPTHKLDDAGATPSLTADKSQIYTIQQDQVVVLNSADLSIVEKLPLPSHFDRLCISPDGRYILTSVAESVAVYENSRPLKELRRFDRHCKQTFHAWSPGTLIATGWSDGRIIIFDPSRAGVPEVVNLKATTGNFPGAFSECNGWLNEFVALANGTDGSVRCIDVRQGKITRDLGRDLHWGKLSYLPHLSVGVVANGGRMRRLISAEITDIIMEGSGFPAPSVSISPNGRYLVAPDDRQSMYDLSNGHRSPVISTQGTEFLRELEEVIWSDSDRIICRSKSKIATFNKAGPDSIMTSRIDLGNQRISQMISAENHSSALLRCTKGHVLLCRFGDDSPRRLPVPAVESILAIAWNSERQVAVMVAKKNIHEWDPQTDVVRVVADTPENCTADVRINSAGDQIAFSGKQVVILDASDYSELARKDWAGCSVRWQSTGELIALHKNGEVMRRWSPLPPHDVVELRAPFNSFRAWNISPAAPVAAATAVGNLVRLVDTRNGAHLGTIIPSINGDCAMISPEGAMIFASPGFRNKIIYQLKTDQGQETLTPSAFNARFGKYLSP